LLEPRSLEKIMHFRDYLIYGMRLLKLIATASPNRIVTACSNRGRHFLALRSHLYDLHDL